MQHSQIVPLLQLPPSQPADSGSILASMQTKVLVCLYTQCCLHWRPSEVLLQRLCVLGAEVADYGAMELQTYGASAGSSEFPDSTVPAAC